MTTSYKTHIYPPLMFAITITLVLFWLLMPAFSHAGGYAAHLIPPSLLKDADAVIRENKTTISVRGLRNAVLTERKVITILNAQGKEFGHFYGIYDNSRSFTSIKGEVYDRNGKQIRRIKSSEINDNSYVSSVSIIEDTRIKSFEVHQSLYPYTVVIEYEMRYSSFVGFPAWVPQYASNLAVQEAELIIAYPADNPLRTKTLNMEESTAIRSGNGMSQNWSVSNIQAFKDEPMAVPAWEWLPVVFIAPDNFYFHDTHGSLNTWQEYGEWVSGLLQNRQSLPADIIQKINDLTANVGDNPREKARIVYEFMQSHTRYVSIQLGLGGFQPFPASMVAGTGYGDCKALSNYTMALLAAVGVESFYTEIGFGNRRIRFDDFPSLDQTNHAILCVPFENDTVWLECTDQRLPFGYVPRSLKNRKALVVSNKDSKLVQMPASSPEFNKRLSEISVKLDAGGDADLMIKTTFFGNRIEALIPEVWQSRKEQMDMLSAKYAPLKGSITDFNLSLHTDDSVVAAESVSISINRYASQTGKRLFVRMYPSGASRSSTARLENRRTDFMQETPYHDYTQVKMILPDNYKVESLPEPRILESKFGVYSFEYRFEDGLLVITRSLKMFAGRYPASEYNAYVDFRQSLARTDQSQFVLVAED
jgi:hypothetical protein